MSDETASAKVRHPELADLLYELAVGLKRLFVEVAQQADLHPTDLEALRRLHAAHEPPAVQELGLELGLSSAAVTGLVDRLERAGHAVRVSDPADRRRVRIRPTEASGRAVLTALSPFLVRLDGALDELNEVERDTAVRFVELVLSALPSATDPTGPAAP